MATPAELARQRQLEQQALARTAAQAATDTWGQVDPGNIAASWARLLGAPLAATAGAQLLAAQDADDYTDEVLGEEGADLPVDGAVNARAFAGIASDGRPLETLLYHPAIQTLQAIHAGAAVPAALALGQVALDMIVRTQVADAGRAATGAAIAARGCGYTRQLTPPSCSRCVILAGKFFRWNAGFQRHPRCDCIHVPATVGFSKHLTVSPRGYFDSLTRGEQDRTFTRAGAEAIREGADMGRVVNARRGMYTAGGRQYTRELAGRRPRLMPEQIYRDARDRDDALRQLRQHGYITGPPTPRPAPTPRSAAPQPAPTPLKPVKTTPVQPLATPPAPPGPAFTETTLTRKEMDQFEARRRLTFAEAELKHTTSAGERARLQVEIQMLRERVAWRGTLNHYNWNAPYWDAPAGIRVTGIPGAGRTGPHIDRIVAPGLPTPLRGELVDELRRQADIVPRSTLDLDRVRDLSGFDHTANGQALAYFRKANRDITFNPRWRSARGDVDSECVHATVTGWWTPRGTSNHAAGTMAHEFGHHVGERALSLATYEQRVALAQAFDDGMNAGGVIVARVREVGDFAGAVNAWLRANEFAAGLRVSQYAVKSYHELMAEIWAEYSSRGDQARKHIRAMGRALQDLAESHDVIRA